MSLMFLQYTMLSGSVPFQVAGPDKASKIMDRIKGGRFSFKGAVWNVVSESAKEIIKGELHLPSWCDLLMSVFG